MECEICGKWINDTVEINGVERPCMIDWTWHMILMHNRTDRKTYPEDNDHRYGNHDVGRYSADKKFKNSTD